MAGSQFLILRKVYKYNFSLVLSLGLLEKFVVLDGSVVCGLSIVILVLSLSFKLNKIDILARAVGVAVGHRSGARLATLLATIFIIIFFPPPFFLFFWHERSALQSVAVQAVDWQRR